MDENAPHKMRILRDGVGILLTFPCIPSIAFLDSSSVAYPKNAKPLGLFAILSITKFTTIINRNFLLSEQHKP